MTLHGSKQGVFGPCKHRYFLRREGFARTFLRHPLKFFTIGAARRAPRTPTYFLYYKFNNSRNVRAGDTERTREVCLQGPIMDCVDPEFSASLLFETPCGRRYCHSLHLTLLGDTLNFGV